MYMLSRGISTQRNLALLTMERRLGVTASLWTWTMSMQDSVYMLFAHHYGSTRDTEEFRSSGVHLTMTDGHVTSSMSMDADRFNGEEHWVAGCVRMVGTFYEFAPVNVFLNSKPDEKSQQW